MHKTGTFAATMETSQIAAFLELVKTGSVLGAAASLDVSRATVRRRLEALEAEVGRPLFEREGDQVVLTRVGRLLEREGPAFLGAGKRLEGALRQLAAEPVSGVLTVAMPNGLPGGFFVPFAAELAQRWPNLQVLAEFCADPLEALKLGADVAIIVGARPPRPWVARLLVELSERAVAHRSYIERRGLPRSLPELATHRLLCWATSDRPGAAWPLLKGGSVTVTPSLVVNDLEQLQRCVEGALGIAVLPVAVSSQPGMQPVLPMVLGGKRRIWLASGAAGRWSPSVRAFGKALADFVTEQLGRLGAQKENA